MTANLVGGSATVLRIRRLAYHLMPPLLVFLSVRLVLAAVASSAGFDHLDPFTWQRWDSGHYLSIATGGYHVVPSCAGTEGYPEVGAPDWCGNGAWMPLYPALLAPFVALGLEPALVGAAIAALLHLATLILLWIGFLESNVTATSLAVLSGAAFFPG